jgi:hypothetical protein
MRYCGLAELLRYVRECDHKHIGNIEHNLLFVRNNSQATKL